MFIGEYTISMDSKGRIAVPAKFRSQLNSTAVITRGLDKSLFIYTKSEWETIAGKLAALPLSKANSRAFARLMLAGAWYLEIDKQCRIILQEYLRKFAALTKPREPTIETGGKTIVRKVPRHEVSIFEGCTEKQVEEAVQSIGKAIESGAPLYNSGNHEACYRIYEGTSMRFERESGTDQQALDCSQDSNALQHRNLP